MAPRLRNVSVPLLRRTCMLLSLLLSLLLLSLLPAAALAAPAAALVGPDVPRPPKPGADAPLEPGEPALSFGTPLAAWLALVPDTDFSRRYLVYGDFEAWFDETGIERPADAADLDALSEQEFEAVTLTLTSQAEPPGVLGAEYVFVEDQTLRVGFSFFNTNQFLWTMGAENVRTLLRVQNDAASIEAALQAHGYSPAPVTGGTLWARGEDNSIDIQADFPLDQLGALNRVAVFAGDDGQSDLLVARATDVITTALAAAAGDADSLLDDMGYRTLAGAIDAHMVPGQLVGVTILGGELPLLDPAEVEDWDVRVADAAKEPLPPYRAAAFATNRDGDDTYLVLYLVLAPGEDAQSTATILSERLMDYVTVVSGIALADELEVTERGSYVSELEVAYVTMRVLEGEGQPFGWLRLINQRDLLFLMPGEEP